MAYYGAMTKTCGTCNETKPVEQFDVSRQGVNGPIYRRHCRMCRRNPELRTEKVCKGDDCTNVIAASAHLLRKFCSSRCRKRAVDRNRRFRKFGGDQTRYEDLLIEQNGRCAICDREQDGKLLAFDHDHQTNKPRGLLCYNCNVGLGSFSDDPRRLQAAILYLETHSKSALRETGL